MPPTTLGLLESLEAQGDVIVMRSLTGNFKDIALPKLGRANVLGQKVNDPGTSGNARWKSVWWDEVRERGKSGKRVEDGE